MKVIKIRTGIMLAIASFITSLWSGLSASPDSSSISRSQFLKYWFVHPALYTTEISNVLHKNDVLKMEVAKRTNTDDI